MGPPTDRTPRDGDQKEETDMTTNKKTTNKKSNEKTNEKTDGALRKRLRADVRLGLEMQPLSAPKGSLRELNGVGRELVKRAPETTSALEGVAMAQVTEACDVADAVLAHNATIEDPVVRAAREGVVGHAATVRGTVAQWAAGDTPVAERAMRVQSLLFPATELYQAMNQHVLWQVIGMKQKLLTDAPTLQAELDTLVPPEVTATLFAANDALGRALPRGERAVAIDRRLAARYLRRRLVRCVAAVIATADPADEAAVRRAMRFLQPLEELREEIAQRQKARPTDGDALEPGEEEEEVAPPATTDPGTG